MVGSESSYGLYLNYMLALLWVVDTAWWWRGLTAYRCRPSAIGVVLHAFFFFMLFNGTVVFGTGPVRWLGLAVTLALAVALVAARPWRTVAP